MTDSLNDEQLAAVTHTAGSVVLSAGAGSGKTRVLVARYLKHLEDGVPAHQLVAITFTEKAAREMRSRIRTAIADRIAEAKNKEERDRWAKHELHLETARISTIHAFGSQLLKTYAKEAGLDPEFEVRTGGPGATFRRQVVADALRELLLAESAEGDDLRELIVLFGLSKVVSTIDDFLDEPEVKAWKAFLDKSPQVIAAEWTSQAKTHLPKEAAAIIDTTPAIQSLRNVQIEKKEGREILQSVLGMLEELRRHPFNVDLQTLQETAKVGSAGKKLYGEENYPTVRDGYTAVREDLCKSKIASLLQIPDDLESAVQVSRRFVAVALHVQSLFAAAKRDAKVIDHSDQLLLTKSLLQGNGTVRERVQDSVQFLLLDELQDTDRVQMQIVELVLGNRFRTHLFAVGDVKQSIYRFRGAEVGNFHQLQESVLPESRLHLAKNFRSVPGILDFVNTLCRVWFSDEAELIASRKPQEQTAVEFLWTAAGEDKLNAEALRSLEAASIAERISRLITGPDARPPGDIVLLFRAMSNVSLYEDALRKRNIDYYLVGGRAYFAQQEVFDIANTLQAIDNPYDSLALVGVLRSPIAALSDDAIAAIGTNEDGLWAGLLAESESVPVVEKAALHRIRGLLQSWRTLKDSMPLSALLQRIIDDSAYDAALLLEPLGERKLANLWKLQEVAREFDRAGASLADFASYLQDTVSRQPKEEQAATVPEKGSTVVRLMTIHHAKGLEFPVVIVPDLGSARHDSSRPAAWWQTGLGAVATIPADCDENEAGYSAWPSDFAKFLDKKADDEEMLRVLYVAFTRAEDLLILSASKNGEAMMEAGGPMLAAVARGFDLNSGRALEGDAPAAVRWVEPQSGL